MNNRVKKEIDNIYNTKQKNALRQKEIRLLEVYESCPQIKETDSLIKIASMALSHNKAGLRPGDKLWALLSEKEKTYFGMSSEQLVMSIDKLKLQKNELLVQQGYSQNYLEDVYECDLCKDTGYVKEGVVQRRCTCYKKVMISILKKQSVMFNENHTFENFCSEYYSDAVNEEDYGIPVSPRVHMQKVLSKVKKFAEDFDNPDMDNMIFSGRTGTGKTYMANCVMSRLLDKGKEVLFMPAGSLFKPFAVYESEEREMMNDLRDMIYGCDLLIIDDLGSEKMTSARYSEFIDILNTREQAGKKNIITTNLTPKNIRDTYDERISSRLLGTYDIYRFTGDDIRLRRK